MVSKPGGGGDGGRWPESNLKLKTLTGFDAATLRKREEAVAGDLMAVQAVAGDLLLWEGGIER